jgi:hypothetical protein
MANVLEECTTKEQRSVVGSFLCAEVLNAKDIHKEMFPVYGAKRFTSGSRNSLKNVRKS